MPLVKKEEIARRQMVLFFVIDCSGSMAGKKIGSVNESIENVLPELISIENSNSDAKIKIAALEFATGVNWLYDDPKPVKEFIWQPAQTEVLTSLGLACSELESKLHQTHGGFMSSGSQSYAPVFILLSDGAPTDNFEEGLAKLKANAWFNAGIKAAIAIGEDARVDILQRFTGNSESVVTVHNLAALKTMINFIVVSSTTVGSSSHSVTGTDKQGEVGSQIAAAAAETPGVNDNTQDIWD